MHSKEQQRILSILSNLFLLVFLLIPILVLFFKAFQNFDGNFVGLDNFKNYLSTTSFKVSLSNSLIVAIISTLISLILAFLFAYGIQRTNIKLKKAFNWIGLLPLFAPTMTHGIALIYLLGRKGVITTLFGLDFDIYGVWGIIISEVLYIFPVVYTMFSLGLRKTDNRLYEAADCMGTKAFRQFRTITLPSVKFTIITAFFAAFTMSFTDFGAPKVIGGNYSVLATEVYKKLLGQQDLEMGAVVGIILTIPAILAFIINIIANKRDKYKVDSKALEFKIKEDKIRDRIYLFINMIISMGIIVIFLTILLSAFTNNWPYDLSFTTKWFNFNVMGMSGWEIFGNSIMVSLFTAILGTTLCFISAYLYERGREFRILNQCTYFMSTLPNVIPGLTLGIAYMFFFNKASNPLNFIYGTFLILILVNIVHFFATPFLTINSELKKIDKEFENVSAVMGVSWFRVIKEVIIPNSWGAIVESFAYYFINSMMTVSAVVFLYFPYTRLASISMINQLDIGNTAAASAVAVMIVLTNIIFRILVDKYIVNVKINKG